MNWTPISTPPPMKPVEGDYADVLQESEILLAWETSNYCLPHWTKGKATRWKEEPIVWRDIYGAEIVVTHYCVVTAPVLECASREE